MGQRIVVLGAGVAGLTAALEVRRMLPEQHRVVVVARTSDFTFRPSLIWAPFGLRTKESVSFPLRATFERKGILFHEGEIVGVDFDRRWVNLKDGGVEPYDLLIVASGGAPDWKATPGLDPRLGFNHALLSWDDAQHTLVAYERLLLEAGDVVVGATRGTSDLPSAYEFALNLAHHLRKQGPKGWMRQTFLTPEPYPGHLGLNGAGAESEKTSTMFQNHGIDVQLNSGIVAMEDKAVILADGKRVPFKFALVYPSRRGRNFLPRGGPIGDAKGFVLVNQHLQNVKYPEVFAAGSAVAMPGADESIGTPRGGHLSEAMGRLAAKNVSASVQGLSLETVPEGGFALRLILDAGDSGLMLSAPSMRDASEEAYVVPGREAHWAKLAFEKYFLATRRRGMT